MKRTAPALGAVFALVFGIAVSFGQEVPAEARRHFEAGVAAVEAAASPADYPSALREFEQAARLGPDWPGAFRGLGMVERAAKKYAEAEKSFRRYLELAPNAADADKIRGLLDEMSGQQGQEAEVRKILEMMASGRFRRKQVGQTVLSGPSDLGMGPLESFRMVAGELQAENGWVRYPDAYHPKQHPPIPRQWEPVKVDGRLYSYTYSHYMDMSTSYVVRYDYDVTGEVVSLAPPRLKETVYWSFTWGAPIEGNKEPWLGDYDREGAGEYLYELIAVDPKPSLGDIDARADADASMPKPVDLEQKREIESLIASGGDVNAPDRSGKPPLFKAVESSQAQIIELLLAHGADINARDGSGQTPLFGPAALGDAEIIELLVDKGADINAKNDTGWTALHLASEKVAALMVAKGADINARNNMGWTPLFNAVQYRPDLALVLIANGADVNAVDKFGQAPLHMAVRTGRIDVVELLVSRGADINAKDGNGETPLQRAKSAYQAVKRDADKKMIDLLKKHGAK
ncbi:MAG: ankyrin repeat domain-containing protein [Acidobacteriota bacterium]